MQYKCVCKFFHNQIKNNHHFMRKFHEVNRGKYDCAVVEFKAEYGRPNNVLGLLLKEVDSDEIELKYLYIPGCRVSFLTCCQGMLCLVLSKSGDSVTHTGLASPLTGYDVLIWNPFIREIKQLPSVRVPAAAQELVRGKYGYEFHLNRAFGFGMCNRSMAWKAVMLWNYVGNFGKNEKFQVAMVCSQRVGDGSWSWKQIDVVPNLVVWDKEGCYAKGRYYWRVLDDCDRNAVIRYQGWTKNCWDIWLMSGSGVNGDVEWNKLVNIEYGASIDRHEYLKPPVQSCKAWKECFVPLGVWNHQGGDGRRHSHLVAIPFQNILCRYSVNGCPREGNNPMHYLVCIDLGTQEMKWVYLTPGKKIIKIVSTSAGGSYVQVCTDTDHINTVLDSDFKIPHHVASSRTYQASLEFIP
ncbi:unnamed protein product [Cuscuta epithymum]|uniref:F-box associated domain-containing protein n=1 Tax=Cuscuta epithymum TaxID=186058 RepID=A0AAV0FNL5_9ASTE|nr:unnamed protein product [Cuscuta epithymum]